MKVSQIIGKKRRLTSTSISEKGFRMTANCCRSQVPPTCVAASMLGRRSCRAKRSRYASLSASALAPTQGNPRIGRIDGPRPGCFPARRGCASKKAFLTNSHGSSNTPHRCILSRTVRFTTKTALLLPTNWRTAIRKIPPPTSAYEASCLYLAQFPGVQSLMILLRAAQAPADGVWSLRLTSK